MGYLADLPELLRGVREYRALGAIFDPVLQDIWNRISAFPAAVLPTEARGGLLERWEQMAGLPMGGSLEQRRFRLLSRLGSMRPYTPEQLRRQLAAAFGREDGFSVDVDGEGFTLSVEVDSAGAEVLSDLTSELRRMIPANMVLSTSVGQAEEMRLYAAVKVQVSGWTCLR